MIDLHMHSTFSDGSLTPEQLVALAVQQEVSALALTDHDTTDGIPRFMAACAAHGLEGVSGVEISADIARGTLHILGYFVEPDQQTFQEVLQRIRRGREDRNQEMLHKLTAVGCPLEWEEVAGLAGEDVVGRPHFAMAMMTRGYVRTKEEAFDRYLGRGKPGYAERFRLSAEASIDAIRHAGGVAVLAHPVTLSLAGEALRAYVTRLRDAGLAGVEVYYSEHGPERVREYTALASALGLVMTGGTDYHGTVNPAVQLGSGFGNLRVEDDVLDALKACRAGVAQKPGTL